MAQYVVKGAAIYNGSTLSLLTWVEKDGVVLTTGTNGTAVLRQLDGTSISSFTTVSAPNSQGAFKFAAITVSLATNTMYMVTAAITDDGSVVRSTLIPVLNFN